MEIYLILCYNELYFIIILWELIEINRFFTEAETNGGKIILTDENVHHIKNVLKMNEKEKLVLIKNKKELLCSIDKIEKNSIIVNVESEKYDEKRENSFSLTLIQGVPKGDKSDFIVEKAVEAGADEIIFVNTKRSVAVIAKAKADKKLERFSKIAQSAACQSGRLIIPTVKCAECVSEIDFSPYSLKLLCYEDEKNTSLREVLKSCGSTESIAVFVGPEGGIDSKEADYLQKQGFKCVTLGSRILRCETAGLYSLACINYELN